MQRQTPLTTFSRFHGWDYSRGATLFITINVEPKRKILGEIAEPGVFVPNDWGKTVERALVQTVGKSPELWLAKYAIMPNHIHFRLVLRPGLATPDALKALGSCIRSFKLSSRMTLERQGHTGTLWQKNYHDHLCLSRESIGKADAYMESNPITSWLLSRRDAPMRVEQPLAMERLPMEAWWAGAGNLGLLAMDAKAVSVRLSRTLKPERYGAVLADCLKAAARGYALVSSYISPCERELFQALSMTPGARIIRASYKGMEWTYKPTAQEARLFAEGRYLHLSRQTAPEGSKRDGWLQLNEDIARMAKACGCARYAKGTEGEKGYVWEHL